jgi:hypothetical protein
LEGQTKMRVLAIFLATLIGFVAASSGQAGAKAYPFAEFGPMSQAGVKAKMQGFLRELASKPDTQGYVIDYGTPRAIAARRKQITRSVTFLQLDPSRITFVDGPPKRGIKILTVMWIVPPGATPPTP